MKRVGLASLLCACALAGTLSAFAFAGAGPGAVTGTTTSPSPAQPLPEGVTIGGLPVGGLLPGEATAAVRSWFQSPLPIRFGDLVFSADPTPLAAPNVVKAVERAKLAQPFSNVKLVVVTRPARIRSYVAKLAARIDRPPIDSRLILLRGKPFVTKQKPGRSLARAAAERAISRSLVASDREEILLRATPIRPRVTRASIGPVIVIDRGTNRLNLYRGMRFWRTFGVATGQSAYPTPLGRFDVVVMWKNPWWYPPASPWAAGQKPIPPGPGNPLGTRWMGLSAPGVGIHGTPDPASIGYSVSHGCIRMRISDAEWLFNQIKVGTTVFIVA
jgi:lipoprotein-anchoring transpeptidase ErfK/SrfK